MIKVLLVPSSDYLGHPFPQRHNQIFERLHDGKYFEVHVVRFRLFDKPKLKTGLVVHELDGKRISHVAPYYLVNAINHASQIRRIIREESIDAVVLSNLAAPLVYSLMDAISSLRIPMIFDLPDYYPTSAAGYMLDVKKVPGKLVAGTFDFMLRCMMRRANVVTVSSIALGEYAKKSGARRVVHVPNGIAECFLRLHSGNRLREKFGYCRGDAVVGYVGSLEFWLDMRSLINGIAIARKRGLSVKLLIIGGRLHSAYSKKVAQWIKEKNLEKHTEFLDFVPHEDVPKYIAGLDLGTIPFDVLNLTAYYSGPNKMWEYFSQRKPVISTPIPEALRNSDCVVTALTPEDYANKLLLISRKENEIQQKVNNGYRKALNTTWKKSAELFASAVGMILN